MLLLAPLLVTSLQITRAQSLLVCVGDPHVWALDPHWRKLLQFAVDHEAYRSETGVLCPVRPSGLGLGLTSSASNALSAVDHIPAVLAPMPTEQRLSDLAATVDSLDAVQSRLAEALSLREVEGAWRLMM